MKCNSYCYYLLLFICISYDLPGSRFNCLLWLLLLIKQEKKIMMYISGIIGVQGDPNVTKERKNNNWKYIGNSTKRFYRNVLRVRGFVLNINNFTVKIIVFGTNKRRFTSLSSLYSHATQFNLCYDRITFFGMIGLQYDGLY